MLSYAFQILNQQTSKEFAAETFSNTKELCAAILVKGVSVQLKRGLGKEFIPKTEALSSLRGKIDITESIKTQSMLRKQLICNFDEFSINSYMSQIIKTTMELLLRSDISKSRKKDLRKLMVFFGEVDTLDVYRINWNLRYNRNNQTYRLLISICYLIVKGLLQTNSDGSTQLMDFLDNQRMSRLYEKFILEYYRKEYPYIKAKASHIPWQTDDGISTMLPSMKSDIMLTYGNKTLIIDAKYYESGMMQAYFDIQKQHSGNLYQIFTYVKNMDIGYGFTPHEVSGMLLYARTDEAVLPDNTYRMSGNKISVRSLNLNCKFLEIARQLNCIVEEHFSEAPVS